MILSINCRRLLTAFIVCVFRLEANFAEPLPDVADDGDE